MNFRVNFDFISFRIDFHRTSGEISDFVGPPWIKHPQNQPKTVRLNTPEHQQITKLSKYQQK